MERLAIASATRFYKFLNHRIEKTYMNEDNNTTVITTIFKTRCDLLGLKSNKFNLPENRKCSLCNTDENETLLHFMARCPILREFRIRHLGKPNLSQLELTSILNGEIFDSWDNISSYVQEALK